METEQPSWSEDNSLFFLYFGAYFVPEREIQAQTICDMIPQMEGSPIFYDLCCGEGLLSEVLLQSFPTARVKAFDGSTVMLEKAEVRLGRFKGRFSTHSFDLTATDWRNPDEKVQAVVSSLGVHHLNQEGKIALFGDVFRMLQPGGVFLMADMIRPVSPAGMRHAASAYDEEVLRRSLHLTGDRTVFDFFVEQQWNFFQYPHDPLDHPSPLLDQLDWLRQAGFEGVDVYWLKAGHAVFGGQKGTSS